MRQFKINWSKGKNLDKPLKLGNSHCQVNYCVSKYGRSLLTTTTAECDMNCMHDILQRGLVDEVVNIHSSKVGCIMCHLVVSKTGAGVDGRKHPKIISGTPAKRVIYCRIESWPRFRRLSDSWKASHRLLEISASLSEVQLLLPSHLWRRARCHGQWKSLKKGSSSSSLFISGILQHLSWNADLSRIAWNCSIASWNAPSTHSEDRMTSPKHLLAAQLGFHLLQEWQSPEPDQRDGATTSQVHPKLIHMYKSPHPLTPQPHLEGKKPKNLPKWPIHMRPSVTPAQLWLPPKKRSSFPPRRKDAESDPYGYYVFLCASHIANRCAHS